MARLSEQRRKVLALIREGGHWEADALHRELVRRGERMGLATVYRALAALEAEGLVQSVEWGGRRRYERADKAHHDHMVCTRCGRIEEFVDPDIELRQVRAAEKSGFRIEAHQLVLFGICARCQEGE
ncbi:MAG: transcriptional repressor [Zetaproteobacteria bacterium]|nr:MAG: transcriptional repressor [Zetaproteobacteria bacterium]